MVKKSAKKQTKTGSKMESKVDSKIDSKKEKKPVSKSEKLIKGEKEVSKKIISFEDLLQKDYFKLIVSIVFVLFVVSIAFQVRSGPINLDGLDNVVESNTYSQIRQLIVQDLSQKNPNLNDFYLQEAVDKEYQKVLDTGVYNFNGEVINVDEMVKINSANLKEAFKADNGQTYLNAIDPYHFLGLSWNYYLNEHTGTFLVENEMGVETPWVDYKLAPVGIPGTYNPEFHIWLESKLYSLNGLDENSSVGEKTKAVYLIPVIFAMLAGLVTFLILRLLTNDLFALFGSLLFVSVGTFVSRTVAGFVDTDAYNVFFPLIIVLFLIYSFINKNVPKSLTFGIISGFFLGMFTWAWGSGWFIFVFIVFSLFIYLLYVLAVNLYIYLTSMERKKKVFFELIKNDFLTMISFMVSSYIFVHVFSSLNIFKFSYNGIFNTVSDIASISSSYIWPNVLSSVAELNSASLDQIIASVGGNIVFIIALLGVVFLILNKIDSNKMSLKLGLILFSLIWFSMILFEDFFKNLIVNKPLFYLIILFLPVGVALLFSFLNKNISNDVFIAILLSTWIAGTIYMSLNGVRFILLLLPAFTVAFGIGLFYICEYINKFFFGSNYKLDNLFSKKSLPGILTVMILFIILYVPVFTQANGISNGTYPNFDDAWYSSMYKIRDNSSEDAIITSWWDFGHFFAITSERGVTFDGGSQTTPRSHWVGKLLMENDELKSHDILRMLVCGGNEAHNVMLSKTSGTSADAVKVNKIIYLTLGKNVDETRKVLKENVYYDFSESDIDEIMLMLKCDSPSENFLVTSGDMVGKAGVWAHWGSWDFTRKYVYDNYNLMKVEDMAEKIDGNVSLIDSYVKQLKQIDIDSKTKNLKRDDLINQWLAPYPSYIPLEGKYQYPCVNSNNTLICQNSIQIDLENGNIKSGFGEDVTFNRVVFPISMDEMGEMKIDENGNFDVLLIPSSNGNYNVMLMQFPLGNSLFTKLYYLNGFGTKQFEKFDDVTSVSGVNVKVWKTNWDVVEELPFELDLSSLIGNQTLEFDIDSEDLDLIGEDSNSSDINPSDN